MSMPGAQQPPGTMQLNICPSLCSDYRVRVSTSISYVTGRGFVPGPPQAMQPHGAPAGFGPRQGPPGGFPSAPGGFPGATPQGPPNSNGMTASSRPAPFGGELIGFHQRLAWVSLLRHIGPPQATGPMSTGSMPPPQMSQFAPRGTIAPVRLLLPVDVPLTLDCDRPYAQCAQPLTFPRPRTSILQRQAKRIQWPTWCCFFEP